MIRVPAPLLFRFARATEFISDAHALHARGTRAFRGFPLCPNQLSGSRSRLKSVFIL